MTGYETHIVGWPLSVWRRVFEWRGEPMPSPHPDNIEPFMKVRQEWLEAGYPSDGLTGRFIL